MTREESNLKQRIRRANNNNKTTKKYEKTPKGFLVRTYRNMLSRVSGVTKSKNPLYLGLEILDKHTFYEWSLNNVSFQDLFLYWQMSDFERRYTPSIDRIDSSKGYTLDNIQWITFSENCKKGVISRNEIYCKKL
jgi:hypothetical protein